MRSGVSILALFAGGVVGVWFDPSDLPTLFQDSAGTTPVTAAGQPVGLMLDKSQGLVLGPELVNVTTGSYVRSVPVTEGFSPAVLLAAGKFYSVTVSINSAVGSASYRLNGSSIVPARNAVNGTVNFILFVPVDGNLTINGDANGASGNVTDFSVLLLPGNHATQATAAKRPTYQTSAGLHWLAFDGVDDAMATAAIDFTGTDKVSVFAGVRKSSDAALGVLLELSSSYSNNGVFTINAPSGAGLSTYAWGSRGTGSAFFVTPSSYAAPVSNVLSGLGDISGDVSLLRANGVQVASSASDQGTGNFGNYALNIGARGQTSLFFNGLFYGLIIPGKLASAAEIASTEAYMAGKTGVVL